MNAVVAGCAHSWRPSLTPPQEGDYQPNALPPVQQRPTELAWQQHERDRHTGSQSSGNIFVINQSHGSDYEPDARDRQIEDTISDVIRRSIDLTDNDHQTPYTNRHTQSSQSHSTPTDRRAPANENEAPNASSIRSPASPRSFADMDVTPIPSTSGAALNARANGSEVCILAVRCLFSSVLCF